MAVKPFFEDSESSFFDHRGMPTRPGVYEFRRYDGMKLLYTLDYEQRGEGEEPRLKVVRASRMSEYPSPAHALNTLEGSWLRYLGPGGTPEASPDEPGAGEESAGGDAAAGGPARPEQP